MNNFAAEPLFGIIISIAFYLFGVFLREKIKSDFINPLLLTIIGIVLTLILFKIPFDDYNQGGQIINLFLGPATASIAYSVFKQIRILKKWAIPIIAGCIGGSLASIGSVYFLCRVFGFNDALTSSIIPKSVTTPIAIEISAQLGGMPSITVSLVILTGILGALFSPFLIRFFHISERIAAGTAIGVSSHGIGTSKAIELGEIEGAVSGIAMGLSGLFTSIFISLVQVFG
jgi:predicted murein hydrolase (TIGR00659 family)